MLICFFLSSTYERVEKTGPYSEAGTHRRTGLSYAADTDTINYTNIKVYSERAEIWMPKQHR